MKKKIFLMLAVTAMLVFALALTASASVIFNDESGNELLRYDADSRGVISGETGVGFAKTDESGNALIWYIVSKATSDSDTVNTVRSIKTADAVTIQDGVLSINKNVVTNASIVSINLDVGNYTTLSAIFNSASYQNCNVMYVYLPKYVTKLNERCFRGASKLISVDVPYDSLLTDYGNFSFWGANNIREFYVPQYVTGLDYGNTLANATGTNNGSEQDFFTNCYALKKVWFHPDNVITEMKNAPLRNCLAETIILSNNLKFMGDRGFRGCKNLKNLYLGDSFEGVYSQYFFYECKALENIYLPATVLQNTTGLTYQWKNAFDSTCVGTFKIHFTGTPDQFIEFYDMLMAAGSNPRAKDLVSDGVINEARVAFTTDCIAFYEGNHASVDGICQRCGFVEYCYNPTHNLEIKITYESYFANGERVVICHDCNCEAANTVAPLFYWVGYSAKTFGEYGFGQQYIINTEALDEYKAVLTANGERFSYGVVAAGASSNGNPLSVVNGAVTAKAGAEFITFDNVSYDAFFMNITGMGEGDLDVSLVCCAYVALGDEVVYLDNNETVSTVTLKSYNQIDAIVNPKEEL